MQSPHYELAPHLSGQSLRVLIWDHDLVDMWSLDGEGRRVPFTGRGSSWHYHADSELTLITSGEGVLYVGDHIGRFAAPDCLLLGSDIPHVWKAEGVMTGVSLQFHREQSAGLGALPELGAHTELWPRARHGLRWEQPAADAISGLILQMVDQPALQRLTLFLHIIRIMLDTHASSAQQLSGKVLIHENAGKEGIAMDRIFDHIMNHYREELTLAELVRMSGTSQATFCRRFHRHTGKTFTAYLNAIRMQDIRRALIESDRSITDIAFSAGFNNLSHFHSLFRRSSGCTPRAFRRQYQTAS